VALLEQIVDRGSQQAAILERLRLTQKPVAIYGAGVYAYVLVRYLAAQGINAKIAMVDAAYKTEASFSGLPVVVTEDLAPQLDDYSIVVGTTNYPAAIARLRTLGASDIQAVDVPDFLNIPEPFMDRAFIVAHNDEFERAFALFEDQFSRDTFVAAINGKVNQDLECIRPYVRADHLYFATTEFPLGDHESLLDVGGFDGDSIRDFNRIAEGQFDRIISLEPFDDSFAKLTETIRVLGLSRALPLKVGAWDEKTTLSFETKAMDIDNRIATDGAARIEVDTIDNILTRLGATISLIKMDINGAEYRALSGAARTVREQKPRIAVKMHVKEDFYRLPILLKAIAPDIRLYLRQRNFMSMMLVLYGIFDAKPAG